MASADTVVPPLSQATGYGVVVGIGLLFAIGMMLVTRLLKAYLFEDPEHSETFMVANRTVGTGLTASAVISSWAWTTAMLSAATVTFNYGVSGAFWFAAGCVVQIAFFAFLAIQAKAKIPNAHTLLEIIQVRYGRVAHIVYMCLCLINNIISVANMLLGASAVVSALTGMDVTAANFLLPLGVVAYTTTGGLKATFLTDYVHTVVILVIIIYFGFLTFSTDMIRSPQHLYDLVNAVSNKTPVAGNHAGSYFTLSSKEGIFFGIIHTTANFGLVIADTSFWQKGFAADMTAAVPGYILGGVAYFSIPFSLGTLMGLAGVALQSQPGFPTYPRLMSATELNNGLVIPYVAQTLAGKGGAGAALAVVFMAVTSTTSAQLIAVSSISAFDIYKTHFRPNATDRQMVRVSHIACIGFGLFMAAFSTALHYGGVSLGWTIYMLGVIVCPSMFPILLTLLWDRQTKFAAITSPLFGMVAGIATWISLAYKFGGAVNIETTGAALPCLYGTIVSAFLPLPTSVILSLSVNPSRYDWSKFNKIERVEDKDLDEHSKSTSKYTAAEKAYMRRGSIISGSFAAFLFFGVWVLWPLPMYGSKYVFSPNFFRGWVIVGQIWAFFAFGVAGILPLVQGYKSIWTVIVGATTRKATTRGSSISGIESGEQTRTNSVDGLNSGKKSESAFDTTA